MDSETIQRPKNGAQKMSIGISNISKKFRKLPDSYWRRVIFTDEPIIQNNPHKQKLWVTDKAQLPLIEKDPC